MQINLTTIFYLLAALQAIFLVVVIICKRKVSNSENCLSIILGMLAITLIHYVVVINKLLPLGNVLMDISAVSWLSISPLLYLYCRFLVDRDEKWEWSRLFYFAPSIYLIVQMLLFTLGIYIGFYLLFYNWDTYTTIWIMGYLINSLIFSILSLRVLSHAKTKAKQYNQLKWLRYYFLGFAILLIVAIGLLSYWLNASIFIAKFEYLLLCGYTVFVFGLAFKSLRFSNYFTVLADDYYKNDRKDTNELTDLYLQLDDYVQNEKPYLQNKLTLKNLAIATDIPENQLSQVFTQHLNSNFYQYINQYRLDAFEQEVRKKGIQQFTIMALAESAGFSSRATFYKVFKTAYGMTPTQYLKQERLLN